MTGLFETVFETVSSTFMFLSSWKTHPQNINDKESLPSSTGRKHQKDIIDSDSLLSSSVRKHIFSILMIAVVYFPQQ